MNTLIRSRKKQIEEFCRAWNIKELQVFGSVTTDHFRPDSDIDVVVDFPPGSPHTLIQLAKMEEELGRDLRPENRSSPPAGHREEP